MGQWMSIEGTANVLTIPSNGQGGICTFRGASTAADTTHAVSAAGVFTVTDANATPFNAAYFGNPAGAFANIAAGDLMVTTDGYWAVVGSKTAPGTVTVREKWRHMTDPRLDGRVPANAASCGIFSPSILQAHRTPRAAFITRIVTLLVTADTADATYDLLCASGTKMQPTTTLQGAATQFTELPRVDMLDLAIRGPFGLRASAAAMNFRVEFANQG